MTYPSLGVKAPQFALQNQRGEIVTLADYIDKNVVVYFYPKALTPGCTTQACDLRDSLPELDALSTKIIGISPDSPPKLEKFSAKYDLSFDLLADQDHAVAKAYGVWGMKKFMGKEFMGVRRTTFVIDKKGKLIGILEDFQTKTHSQVLVDWLKTNSKV